MAVVIFIPSEEIWGIQKVVVPARITVCVRRGSCHNGLVH